LFLFFFFSSRRRHTRFDCDWSSDVCSSDLKNFPEKTPTLLLIISDLSSQIVTNFFWEFRCAVQSVFKGFLMNSSSRWVYREALRSEERRVGKECRSRVWP